MTNREFLMRRLIPGSALLILLAPPCFAAEATDAATPLETVEISATRLRGVPDVDVPASVATIQLSPEGNQPQIDITEVLSGLAGVTALNRQNYAQDTQLSIRGFGARATFGVRGVRLYADGIPASMPDGQGQLSNFSVMGADRVQVMRGPFSALYGNSSGGVVQMWSRPGEPGDPTRVRATYGSNDTRSLGAQTLGQWGLMDYNLAVSRFETDGYRDHSAARRDSINARLGFDLGARRTLSLVLNYVDIPEAQDALGLSPAEWRADPRQATPVATQFNTRKSVQQFQGGLVFEQGLGDAQTLRASAYAGNRQIVQYLAIPIATQANPLHSGGVVDLDSGYHGADLRWSWQGELASRPVELTVGTNYDIQQQLRLGYTDFVGTTVGVRGAQRRNENDNVDNFDQFAQVWWQFAPHWSLLAGLRHSTVEFESVDHYIVGTNPNDSGQKQYGDTTPVAGLMFHPIEPLRLYFSVGQGFETPTFNEMSYRADGGAGLAFNLKAARSENYELGAKWRGGNGVVVDSALFRTSTQDELALARNVGGRSSYRNTDARRQGFEVSTLVPLATDWQLDVAYTYLDAEFRKSFLICTSVPCTVANVTVPAGSPLPGVPRHQGQVSLKWTPGPWSAALEAEAISHLVVNDNDTVAAPGHGLVNAEVGRNWKFNASQLRAFARVENLFNRKVVGSVIINEANGRYFESGPDRTALIGAQWLWR